MTLNYDDSRAVTWEDIKSLKATIAELTKERDELRAELEALKAPQEPVARVVSSGEYNFPCLEWISANHSLGTPIGTMLYALAPVLQDKPVTQADTDLVRNIIKSKEL